MFGIGTGECDLTPEAVVRQLETISHFIRSRNSEIF